jgi:5-methylcytosine-specific restriction protein A
VRVDKGYCPAHQPRRIEQAWRQWYHTTAWRQLRTVILQRVAVCPGLDGMPCGEPTTDVDHRVPHRGNPRLFWDPSNLDAYCHQHHSVKTGRGL